MNYVAVKIYNMSAVTFPMLCENFTRILVRIEMAFSILLSNYQNAMTFYLEWLWP
jgi:hypothetical protein